MGAFYAAMTKAPRSELRQRDPMRAWRHKEPSRGPIKSQAPGMACSIP
jgi:hypothetical protein